MRSPTLAIIDFVTQTKEDALYHFSVKEIFPKKVPASSIREMDVPSTSSGSGSGSGNNPNPFNRPLQEAMDADMEMDITSSVLKRAYSSDDDDDDMVFEPSSSNHFPYQSWMSRPVFQMGQLVSNQGVTKKRKLNCGNPQNVEIHDENSNSSNISITSRAGDMYEEPIYVEPIYVSPTSENYPNIYTPPFEPGPMTYNNEENFVYGNWILITNVRGGWSYRFVKIFLCRQLGLDCLKGKPLPGTHPTKDDFRIIVRFTTKEERDKMLEFLLSKHVTHYFKYSSIDVLPVGCYDVDTDDEDDYSYRPLGGPGGVILI